jgi:hypothetical protein
LTLFENLNFLQPQKVLTRTRVRTRTRVYPNQLQEPNRFTANLGQLDPHPRIGHCPRHCLLIELLTQSRRLVFPDLPVGLGKCPLPQINLRSNFRTTPRRPLYPHFRHPHGTDIVAFTRLVLP